jgi:hypothetical protein
MQTRQFTLLAGCLFGLTQLSHAQTTYTGEAAVAKVNVLGILNASIQDTGQLPSSGGSLSTELLSLTVPDLLSLNLLSASTDGANNETDSAASVVQVTITAAPAVSGTSTVVGLKVNGLSVKITGQPNQTIPLLVGSLVINEQISSVVNQPNYTTADMLVNALHLKVGFLADVIISQSHAGVTCQTVVLQEATRPARLPPGVVLQDDHDGFFKVFL